MKFYVVCTFTIIFKMSGGKYMASIFLTEVNRLRSAYKIRGIEQANPHGEAE